MLFGFISLMRANIAGGAVC